VWLKEPIVNLNKHSVNPMCYGPKTMQLYLALSIKIQNNARKLFSLKKKKKKISERCLTLRKCLASGGYTKFDYNITK